MLTELVGPHGFGLTPTDRRVRGAALKVDVSLGHVRGGGPFRGGRLAAKFFRRDRRGWGAGIGRTCIVCVCGCLSFEGPQF